VAEKLDWKGLNIKKSVGNRKIIMPDEVRYRIGKGCEYSKRTFRFHKMRGISWLAAKIGQLLKRDSAPWSK
jgi:hypothetical protein